MFFRNFSAITILLFFSVSGCTPLRGGQIYESPKSPCEANYKSEGSQVSGYKTSTSVNFSSKVSNVKIFGATTMVLTDSGYTILSSDKENGIITSHYNAGEMVQARLSVQIRSITDGTNIAIKITTPGVFGDIPADCCEVIAKIEEVLGIKAENSGNTEGIVSEKKEPPVASQAPIEKKKISSRVVTKVQQQLLDLGYTPGPADGKMGKGTIKAIKQFQQENHLAETGQADKKTISMLEQKTKEQSVQPSPQPQSAVTTSPQAENIDTLPASSRIPVTETTKDQNQAPAKTVSPMDL